MIFLEVDGRGKGWGHGEEAGRAPAEGLVDAVAGVWGVIPDPGGPGERRLPVRPVHVDHDERSPGNHPQQWRRRRQQQKEHRECEWSFVVAGRRPAEAGEGGRRAEILVAFVERRADRGRVVELQ